MAKTIVQSMTFPARAARLYALYADSKLHGAATGQKAAIGKAAGGRFSAFGGMITGKLLHLKRNQIIVQTWRGKHWKSSDKDSVLVLRFEDTPQGGLVRLVHAHVPDHDEKGVAAGWRSYYWEPWRKYLANAGKGAHKKGVTAARRKGHGARAKVSRKAAPRAKGMRKVARTTRTTRGARR